MKKDYVILNLEKEYPGFTGAEKWMIITDLCEAEFSSLYPDQYPFWRQAVIMSLEMGKAIFLYHNNERKQEWRDCGLIPLEDICDITSDQVPATNQLSDPDLINALNTITDDQYRRITKYYLKGYSKQEIADDEQCSIQAVSQSIKRGLKRLKKIMPEKHLIKEEA